MELHWHDNWLWTSCLACGGVSSSVWTGKGHHGEMKNQVVAFQTDPPGWWLMWNIHHTNVHINIYIHSYFTLSYTHIYIINYLNLYLSIQQYKNQYIYICIYICKHQKYTYIIYIYIHAFVIAHTMYIHEMYDCICQKIWGWFKTTVIRWWTWNFMDVHPLKYDKLCVLINANMMNQWFWSTAVAAVHQPPVVYRGSRAHRRLCPWHPSLLFTRHVWGGCFLIC